MVFENSSQQTEVCVYAEMPRRGRRDSWQQRSPYQYAKEVCMTVNIFAKELFMHG